MPTIHTTWGELFDQVAELELNLEREADEASRADLGHRLELLRDMARTDAPGAVHAVASELKEVDRGMRQLDEALAEMEARDDIATGYAELARAFRQQITRRHELKSSIDHLMGAGGTEEGHE